MKKEAEERTEYLGVPLFDDLKVGIGAAVLLTVAVVIDHFPLEPPVNNLLMWMQKGVEWMGAGLAFLSIGLHAARVVINSEVEATRKTLWLLIFPLSALVLTYANGRGWI